MIEISAPELFPMSRQKFGEIVLPCDRAVGAPLPAPLFTRLPGVIIQGLTPRRIQPEGYTPLLTLST